MFNYNNEFLRFNSDIVIQKNIKQRYVIEQLIKYIQVKANNPYLSRKDTIFHTGQCFSFTFCYAALRYLIKDLWFLGALHAVVSWDGKENSLQQLIKLPQSDNKEGEILDNIFTRILNYLSFHQANLQLKHFLGLTDLNHFSLLQPNGYFELLCNGEIKKIKGYKAIAGNFSIEQMKKLLSDDVLEAGFCFISTGTHVILLGKSEKNYYIYDSNCAKGVEDFDQYEDFMEKVLNFSKDILNVHEVIIRLVSLDKYSNELPLLEYSDLIKDPNEHFFLLKNFGMNDLLNHRSDYFKTAWIQAILNPLQNTLLDLVSALECSDKYHRSTLYLIAKKIPDSLDLIFKTIAQNDDYLKIFDKIITKSKTIELDEYVESDLEECAPTFFQFYQLFMCIAEQIKRVNLECSHILVNQTDNSFISPLQQALNHSWSFYRKNVYKSDAVQTLRTEISSFIKNFKVNDSLEKMLSKLKKMLALLEKTTIKHNKQGIVVLLEEKNNITCTLESAKSNFGFQP